MQLTSLNFQQFTTSRYTRTVVLCRLVELFLMNSPTSKYIALLVSRRPYVVFPVFFARIRTTTLVRWVLHYRYAHLSDDDTTSGMQEGETAIDKQIGSKERSSNIEGARYERGVVYKELEASEGERMIYGPDGIPVEVWESLGEEGVDMLLDLLHDDDSWSFAP